MIPGLIINNNLRSLYNRVPKSHSLASQYERGNQKRPQIEALNRRYSTLFKYCKVPENSFQIDAKFMALRAN